MRLMEPTKLVRLKFRLLGLLVMGVGAFLLKMTLFDVLQDAARGAPDVSTSQALLIAPGFMLMGLFVVIVGGNGSEGAGRHLVDESGRRLSPLGWISVAVIFAPGVILYFWLRSQLGELGYR